MQSPKLTLKIQLNEDIRRVPAASTLTFDELCAVIRNLYRFENGKEFAVKYLDDENDLCTISSNEELVEAVRFAPGLLRLKVTLPEPKPEPVPEPMPEIPVRTCPVWPHKGQIIRQSSDLQRRAIDLMTTDAAGAKNLFLEQLRMCPPFHKAACLYNLSCCESLLGHADAALALLSQSIEAGFTDVAHMRSDPDMNNIKHLPAFNILLSGIEERPPVREELSPHKLFNMACFFSLMGNVENAVNTLEKAITAGFCRVNQLLNNSDLEQLHKLESWQSLVDRAIKNREQRCQNREQRRGKCPRKFCRPVEEPTKVQELVQIEKPQEPVQIEKPQEPVQIEVVTVEAPDVNEPEVAKVEIVEIPKPVEAPKASTALDVLEEMGFLDKAKNEAALTHARGDIEKAIIHLLK